MTIKQKENKIFLFTPKGIKIEVTKMDASALNGLIERI